MDLNKNSHCNDNCLLKWCSKNMKLIDHKTYNYILNKISLNKSKNYFNLHFQF